MAACAALAALVRLAAFEVGPTERADGWLLAHAPLEWGTPMYRIASTLVSAFDPVPYGLLLCAIVAAALVRRRRRAAVAAAAAMGAAAVIAQALKAVLAQPRPLPRGWWYLPPDAWPSGHTTAAAAFAFAIVLVTPRTHRRHLWPVAAAIPVLVGASMVALGSHYLSDVLGGLCIATACGAAAFAFERAGERARGS
jgi:membrane-associated phospholipid phosphatase